MFCTGLHRQPFLLYTEMAKVNKSITIDEDIAKSRRGTGSKKNAVHLVRLLSILVNSYLMALKKPKSVGKKIKTKRLIKH